MFEKRLFLIDATAFCYRAFYAVRGLSTSFGLPTNAIYGFVNILNKILKEQEPGYMAVCFDVSRDTFRQKKFAEYKIQRPPMPDELGSQIPLIKEIISAYGLIMFQKQGFEADDIIATLKKKADNMGLAQTIVSSDKDILQLVDEHTLVFSPYKDEGTTYDRKAVLTRFGVEPWQIVDIIALMGDAADNIPGVPGIGEKTAAKLLKSYGSLDNLLKDIDEIKQEKVRLSIKDNLEQIKLSRQLAVLDSDVDIDFDLAELKIKKPDTKELFRIFKYLEFNKFLKELTLDDNDIKDSKLHVIDDLDLEESVDKDGELIVFGPSKEDLVFYTKEKLFRLKATGGNIKKILGDSEIKKVSHDLKKLKISLENDGIAFKGLYFDTMIAAYLLNPSKSNYDLTDVAWDYVGTPFGSAAVENIKAVSLITQLKPKLENELREKSLSKLFWELEMPLVDVLAHMELNGIKIDLQVLKILSQDLEKKLIVLIKDIYDLSGAQFNINSPKQLREVLFERLKLPVYKKSKTGPSTDEEVLRNLADKHKLPALLLEYRQLTKLKNTYIDTLPELVDKKTGRIHASFNQFGTETGRLSSSNPNLQNIPIKTEIGKNIRRAIIASGEKNYILSCDYSQIELRILAHLSKDRDLISAFKEDKDIHKITAALIFRTDEANVTDQMRDVAKRVNFGIVYGQTSYSLSRDLGVSFEEAQNFIDAYFNRYPMVKNYVEKQIEKAQKDGFVTTLLGRRRYIPEINNKNQSIRQFAERQAANTPIQGSAADLIKLAMISIDNQLSAKNLETMMIMQIHDELVFDVPQEELSAIVTLVKDRMENCLELDVPVRVDMKKGKNWLEMEGIK